MPDDVERIELQVGSRSDIEFTRNIECLYKNGDKADIDYELEQILMGSGLQTGDSVILVVEIEKNHKEPSE